MTILLAFATFVPLGTWITVAQLEPGVTQRARTFYVTVGNLVLAGGALLIGNNDLSFGWRSFWLPMIGGLVWTLGNFAAFRASETIGLARAAGTWTPLNIVVAFVWGAVLFGELDHLERWRFAVLGTGLVVVFAGVAMIIRSQSKIEPEPTARTAAMHPGRARRRGLVWAVAAGVLWGSYFIPAQWAAVPATSSNFPLAIGIFFAGALIVIGPGAPVRLGARATTVQLLAGALFGVGDLALLGLVSRVGTGVGFTIAQLSLLVNASLGVWVFRTPAPGSRQARTVLTGVVLAGLGGGVIGALR